MGHVSHHAIIVTSDDPVMLRAAQAQAESLELRPSSLCPQYDLLNGYQSFLVPPSGSKNGWSDSERHQLLRAAFIKWMREQRYDDKSNPLEWVMVRYGNDNYYGLRWQPDIPDSEWHDQ